MPEEPESETEEPEEINWFEEGQKQFVTGQTHPGKPPTKYPTQDIYLPKDEAEYIRGFNSQKAAFERGEGFGGIEGYADEHSPKPQILKVKDDESD